MLTVSVLIVIHQQHTSLMEWQATCTTLISVHIVMQISLMWTNPQVMTGERTTLAIINVILISLVSQVHRTKMTTRCSSSCSNQRTQDHNIKMSSFMIKVFDGQYSTSFHIGSHYQRQPWISCITYDSWNIWHCLPIMATSGTIAHFFTGVVLGHASGWSLWMDQRWLTDTYSSSWSQYVYIL